jgi:hypothetical protein
MRLDPISASDARDIADTLYESISSVELLHMACHALGHDRAQQNAMQDALFDLNIKLTRIKDVLSGEVEERSDRS